MKDYVELEKIMKEILIVCKQLDNKIDVFVCLQPSRIELETKSMNRWIPSTCLREEAKVSLRTKTQDQVASQWITPNFHLL